MKAQLNTSTSDHRLPQPGNRSLRFHSVADSNRVLQITLSVVLALLVTSQSEAQWYRNLGKPKQAPPTVFNQVPTQQQLVDHLKSNADLVNQLSANVSVSIPGAPKIKGNLQVEFPNRMRLKAGLLGINEAGVDVGSNEHQFWIWSRASLPNQPPAFYFANHHEYEQSAMRQALPLDPKWLIEGLGLMRMEPSEISDDPKLIEGGWIKFYTTRQTATGPQLRQVLMNARTGLIAQQAIYVAGASGFDRIAYANSTEYQTQTVNGRLISLPQRVQLFMSQPDGTDMEVMIKLSSISLDPLYGAPEAMWGMPNPDGIAKINLAQVSSLNQGANPLTNQPNRSSPSATGVGYSQR